MSAAVRMDVEVLGPPVVRRTAGGAPPEELVWRLRRSLQTVAFLALEPSRRGDKEALADALWPDASAEVIRKNFHPTLSDARRTLGKAPGGGSAILHRQGYYALAPTIDWRIDVDLFRERVAEGTALRGSDPAAAIVAWTSAWRLYRGHFLPGLDAPWAGEHRQTLRDEYIDLLRRLGFVCAAQDRLTEALDAYRGLLLEEPYEEYVHREAMELYARQGRRDLVRRQYVRLQEQLKELGVEPMAETQGCYHRLMR